MSDPHSLFHLATGHADVTMALVDWDRDVRNVVPGMPYSADFITDVARVLTQDSERDQGVPKK